MYKVISILLGMAVIGSLIWGVTQCSSKIEFKNAIVDIGIEHSKQIKYRIACYDSCVSSKKKTDTIRDTIPKYLGWRYKEKELTPADSQLIYNYFAINAQTGDTLEVFEVTYDDTLYTEDFELYWYAKVVGYMSELGFPGYKIYKEKIIESWIINNPPPPVDPVIEYVYHKGWYITGAVGNDFRKWTSWTSIEGGIGYMTRKGVSFGADYQYLSLPYNDKKVYGSFVKIRLNYFFGK